MAIVRTKRSSPRPSEVYISTSIASLRLTIFDPSNDSLRCLDVPIYPRDGAELGEIAQAHFETYIGYATGPVSLAEYALKLLEIAEGEPREFHDFGPDDEPEDLSRCPNCLTTTEPSVWMSPSGFLVEIECRVCAYKIERWHADDEGEPRRSW